MSDKEMIPAHRAQAKMFTQKQPAAQKRLLTFRRKIIGTDTLADQRARFPQKAGNENFQQRQIGVGQ